MKALIIIVSALVVLMLLASCAAPGAPTAAPKSTEPAKPAPGAPTAAAAAPAAAPTAAPKPAAATPTSAAKIKRGGTVVFARNNVVDDLDIVTSITFVAPIVTMVYEHLLTYDLVDVKTGKHELKPQLAESWDVSDPSKIVLKLKKGVKFADGSDFTAEVAKWNLDRVVTHPKSQGKSQMDVVQSVDVIDPSTIRVNLKSPSATALLKLSNGVSGTASFATAMASKAAVDKGGPEALSSNPIGTGPMVLDQWMKGDRVSVKKRDGYWQMGEDGQALPYLDGFVDRYIPDSAVQNVELRTGNVQWVGGSLNLSDIASVKSNPELVYEERPWAGTLQFVHAFNSRQGPFANNQKLRQAAMYAIDKQQMATTMGFGFAKPAYYIYWVPGVLGYDETVNKYQYDTAKAKQTLADAGYPNGVDVSLDIIARDPDRKIAEIAKFMWDAVGIRTTIDAVERAAGLARYQSGNFTIGFYNLALLPDPDLFAPKALMCNSMNNWTNWCNKDFDACIAEGGKILDPQQRDTIYKRCLKIMMDEAFVGSGYLQVNFNAYSAKMKGEVIHYADGDARWVWLDK